VGKATPTAPDGPVPGHVTGLIRHFIDLRDGTHGGAVNRMDKEAHFAKAVELLGPFAQVPRTLTARATTSATVTSETHDCASIAIFAHRDSGRVSVGLKAVALVNDR
jgi:hypothetical protein